MILPICGPRSRRHPKTRDSSSPGTSSEQCAGRGVARAVLDPGVLVSALITPTGRPAKLLVAARAGSFDLIVSPLLLDELERVLRREKFRRYVDLDGVTGYLNLLRHDGQLATDPETCLLYTSPSPRDR